MTATPLWREMGEVHHRRIQPHSHKTANKCPHFTLPDYSLGYQLEQFFFPAKETRNHRAPRQ